MLNKYIPRYRLCEVNKKGKVLFKYYEGVNLEYARKEKKRMIHHLTESNNLNGTVVILDNNNKIVN